MLKQICRKHYQEYIRLHQHIPMDLKRALKVHERVPVFIDRLSSELDRLPPGMLDGELIRKTVYDMTEWFIMAVRAAKDQKMMSDLERAARQAAIDRAKELNEAADQLLQNGDATRVTNQAGQETHRTTIEVPKELL